MEIVWTQSAKNDLRKNYTFLIVELSINNQKATAIIDAIIKRIEFLEKMPNTGQKEPKFEKLKKEYRRLIEGDYKIVYHVRKPKVYINRIFDSRQNPNKLTIR